MDNIFDAYATDVKAEEEGTEIELRNGAKIRIRSENSTKVRNFIARLVRKQRNIILREGGSLPAELQDKNEIDICAEVLVVGWSNVVGPQGEIAYTKQRCRELVTALPALRRDILMQARLEDTFKKQEAEEMSGNSAAPSGAGSAPAQDS